MTTPPVVVRALTPDALAQDASNRALRTLLQNLLIDLVVAIALAVQTVFSSARSFGAIDWGLLGFLVAKTVIATVISFVMRRFGDASGLSTLPPPSDPKTDTGNTAVAGDPVDPDTTAETASEGAVTVQTDPGTPVQADPSPGAQEPYSSQTAPVNGTSATYGNASGSAAGTPIVPGDIDGDGFYDGKHAGAPSQEDPRPPAA